MPKLAVKESASPPSLHSSEFSFPELDTEGMETLEAIANADHFNEWMYQTVSSRLTGEIIEIGSGIGNISQFFERDGRYLHLSDIRQNYCDFLRQRFGNSPGISGVSEMNWAHPEFERAYPEMLERFDGVFALNVLEHIENDSLAVANGFKLLKPGGRMVILVPAGKWLYNEFDKSLEHFRRYNKKSLTKVLRDNHFEIAHQQYFNTAGMPGWFLSGALCGNRTIPAGQMRLFNTLVPLFKVIDKCVLNQFGLSVIVEGIKPA